MILSLGGIPSIQESALLCGEPEVLWNWKPGSLAPCWEGPVEYPCWEGNKNAKSHLSPFIFQALSQSPAPVCPLTVVTWEAETCTRVSSIPTCNVRLSLSAAVGGSEDWVSAFASGNDMVEKPHLLEVEHRTQKAQYVPTPPHVEAALASSWFIDFILQQKGVWGGAGKAKRCTHSPVVSMGPVSVWKKSWFLSF